MFLSPVAEDPYPAVVAQRWGFCKLCQIDLHSEIHANEHVEGQTHQLNERLVDEGLLDEETGQPIENGKIVPIQPPATQPPLQEYHTRKAPRVDNDDGGYVDYRAAEGKYGDAGRYSDDGGRYPVRLESAERYQNPKDSFSRTEVQEDKAYKSREELGSADRYGDGEDRFYASRGRNPSDERRRSRERREYSFSPLPTHDTPLSERDREDSPRKDRERLTPRDEGSKKYFDSRYSDEQRSRDYHDDEYRRRSYSPGDRDREYRSRKSRRSKTPHEMERSKVSKERERSYTPRDKSPSAKSAERSPLSDYKRHSLSPEYKRKKSYPDEKGDHGKSKKETKKKSKHQFQRPDSRSSWDRQSTPASIHSEASSLQGDREEMKGKHLNEKDEKTRKETPELKTETTSPSLKHGTNQHADNHKEGKVRRWSKSPHSKSKDTKSKDVPTTVDNYEQEAMEISPAHHTVDKSEPTAAPQKTTVKKIPIVAPGESWPADLSPPPLPKGTPPSNL